MASAPLLIESLDYTPIYHAKRAEDWDRVGDILCDSAIRLERAGAEGLVVAAVTAHKAYDRIADAVGIPVLHSGDAVGRAMVRAS